MYGVTFGNLQSYNDLGLILASKVISEPQVKAAYVTIPGGNGSLDYTDYFGEPFFADRSISLEFLSLDEWTDQMVKDSTVKNALHGRRMEIRFDDDPGWYWNGRVSVGAWRYDRGAGKLPMTITADPYKLADQETVVTKTVASGATETVTLTSGRKTVLPIITTGGASFLVSFTIDETTYSVALEATAAEQTIEELLLSEGSLDVTVQNTSNASGTIKFRWRNGAL